MIDTVTSIYQRTKQDSGMNASYKLASIVEQALAMGHATSDLTNKTEKQILHLISTHETSEAEKELQSKATHVTLSEEEQDQVLSEEANSSEEEEEDDDNNDDDDDGSKIEGEGDLELDNQPSSDEENSSNDEDLQSSSSEEESEEDDENDVQSESEVEEPEDKELEDEEQISSSDGQHSMEEEEQPSTSEGESENDNNEMDVDEDSESESVVAEVVEEESSDDESIVEVQYDSDELIGIAESDVDDGEMASDEKSLSDSESEKSSTHEDQSDEDGDSIASDSTGGAVGNSVLRPLGRRGSWHKPSLSFNNGTNKRRVAGTSSFKGASRFSMWRKKNSTVSVNSKPERKPLPKKKLNLNEERWEKHVEGAFHCVTTERQVPFLSYHRFITLTSVTMHSTERIQS